MAAEKYRLPEKKRFNFKLMQRLLPTQFSLDKTTDEDLPHIFPGKTYRRVPLKLGILSHKFLL